MSALEKAREALLAERNKLHDSLSGDEYLCMEHKKMMMYFLDSVLKAKESEIKAVRTACKGFFESITRAQKNGESMEAGLKRRKKFMEEKGIENEYQKRNREKSK